MAAAEAVAQQGWSSLPADLVNLVADSILATNDLDYYMDLRAVCHGWRSSTADPKISHDDARLRPTRWIVLSDTPQGDTCLFVNATTGRFLRRRLPVLRDYLFVTSTTGGFLVLADREPPHAARVVNPFTGSLIRFKAPIAPDEEPFFAADVVGDLPKLVLSSSYGSNFRNLFLLADPDSHRFVASTPEMISDLITLSALLVLSRVGVKLAPGGELLLVDRWSPGHKGVRVFRMGEGAKEKVTNIGSYALFLGNCRCVSVRADRFPSVNANCIYYLKVGRTISDIYMYDLAHNQEEIIADASMYFYMCPESIIQLLLDHTFPLR